MNCYYGTEDQDIDGNRGRTVIYHDIEEDDTDEIIEELYERFITDELDEYENVFLFCYLIDDVIEVEVKTDKYIDALISKAEAQETDKQILDFIKSYKKKKDKQ